MGSAVGYFESRAREARRQRERTSWEEDEIAPIQIKAMSHTAFGDLKVAAVKALLDIERVVFLKDAQDSYYAMLSPISFEYLLQVAEVLRDERRFTVVKPA